MTLWVMVFVLATRIIVLWLTYLAVVDTATANFCQARSPHSIALILHYKVLGTEASRVWDVWILLLIWQRSHKTQTTARHLRQLVRVKSIWKWIKISIRSLEWDRFQSASLRRWCNYMSLSRLFLFWRGNVVSIRHPPFCRTEEISNVDLAIFKLLQFKEENRWMWQKPRWKRAIQAENQSLVEIVSITYFRMGQWSSNFYVI